MAVTTTNLVKYSVLPGVWPRVKELFGSGFSFLASVIAVLYFNLGLLPAGHPYLDHHNYGRFGIRHVIAAAGKNLVFSRKHTDQVILYFTIIIGLVILALQIVLLVMTLLSSPVFAGPVTWADATFTYSWSSYFVDTPHGPLQDLAFIVLDQVFGVMLESGTADPGGFFGSCYSTLTQDCYDIRGNTVFSPTLFPTPMHLALHQMLAFYTMGIAFLAGAVILYFIVTIVGETVTTGTPFGQRFSKAWFIPRLIMFFALLAPITFTGNNSGLNVAQLITFASAKFGSNMATNAWLGFVDEGIAATASTKYSDFLGQGKSMLAMPNIPELGNLVQFMQVVRTCMYAHRILKGITVEPYIVRAPSNNTSMITLVDGSATVPYNTMSSSATTWTEDYQPYFDTAYADGFIRLRDAVQFSRYQDVVLRFGHRNPPGGSETDRDDPPDAYDDEWGNIEPTCGELKFEITSLDPFIIGPAPAGNLSVQGSYWTYIDYLLAQDTSLEEMAYCMVSSTLPYDIDGTCIDTPLSDDPGVIMYVVSDGSIQTTDVPVTENETQLPTVANTTAVKEAMNVLNKARMNAQVMDWDSVGEVGTAPAPGINERMVEVIDNPAYVNNLTMPLEIRERGWVGAALWYNKLAEINGIYSGAVQNIPRPFKYPAVMEEVAKQHLVHDNNNAFTARFNPRLANGELADLFAPEDQSIAAVLYQSYEFWNRSAVQETLFTRQSSNVIIDTINMILGTNGIFDILENKDVYPLAMLSGLGKSMVDAALRNLFAGIVGQGVGEIFDGFIGGMGKVASTFAFRFGMIGISIGFILYYVLPLLPFIYFFFAFSGWIKSIFEAMLAMPLWALAHIKIDGNGLSGPWASNGYFLIFEIFLRPILIIFGFIFSISMYAALVDGLHDSYHLLTYVAAGYDMEAEMNSSFRDITAFTSTEGISFMRGPVDEMFYTIIYVIMVYMIGLSCFKLVDTIPNNIMRWMGVTVSTIQENAGDPAGQMTSKLFRGTQITNMQVIGMISKAQGFKDTSTQDIAATSAMLS